MWSSLDGYRKKVQYWIVVPGITSYGLSTVTLDSKYAFVNIETESSFAIIPQTRLAHPTLDDVIFYTNCISYELDLPAFPQQRKGKAPVQPIGVNRTLSYDDYLSSIQIAYEELNSLRFRGVVKPKWGNFDTDVDLHYTNRYSNALKELSLYSSAIRQLDPLSEYLGYYRVIESVSGDNGKKWIYDNLSRLDDYDFGLIEHEHFDISSKKQLTTNLFSIYKRRALGRLKILRRELSEKDLVRYFYNETRCGIAHGKSAAKVSDFKYHTIENIAKDNYIMKLLSRIAIEDKL